MGLDVLSRINTISIKNKSFGIIDLIKWHKELGYPGSQKLYFKLKRHLNFEKLTRKIKQIIAACITCQ